MYHYAGNNPVKYTDPDGRVPQAAAALWVVLFVAVTLEAYLQTPAGQQGCQALCEAISYGAESATKTISNAIAALGTAVLDVDAVIENYAKNKSKGKKIRFYYGCSA